ncbi:MAG: hypothetical protein AAGF48_11895 [Pseudomonadota bacterium]
MRHVFGPLTLACVLVLASPSAWAADESEAADADATTAENTPETGDSADLLEPEIWDDAPAEDTAVPDAPILGPQVSSKVELTPEEKAEKESRKACKIELCDIIATREPIGEDIACDIKKTWRADSLTKMLGDQFSWPWGKAVCKSKLNLSRTDLAAAMLESNTTVKMEKFAVSCELHTGEGEPYIVEMELAPEVTFDKGKAVSAAVNWGDVSAPLVIYPVVYAGTGLDNRSNLLGSSVVTMVNEFTHKKCAEVKDELPGRRVN